VKIWSEYWVQTTTISEKECRVSAETGPLLPLSFYLQHPQRGQSGCVNSRYCANGQITYGPTPPSRHWRHHARPRALLDPGSPKATRWHFSEHYLRSPPDRTARQRRHRLPALHFRRRDCRARRQVDHDHQSVASLNTIAPDGPSGTSPATTHLPSNPDCAGSELISCTVASVCLRHDTLGTRHP
jgi:hypothetical protein